MRTFRLLARIGFGLLAISLVGLLWLVPPTHAQHHEIASTFLHRVVPGESLYGIARRYLSVTDAYRTTDLIQEIREINSISGTLIHPNQVLQIPLARSNPGIGTHTPRPKDFEARGIYINRYSMATQKMTRLLHRFRALGGNAVILDAKDMRGKLSYSSDVELAQAIGASANPEIGNLAKLINSLHGKGLHVGVRIVLFYDPILAKTRPELAVRSISTGQTWREKGVIAWVDPSQPSVQEYNLDIAKELANMGVDEIQFDYIRFPAMGDVWDAAYSFDEEKTPKHSIITSFLERAWKELAPYDVLLSIDVFGIAAWDRPEDSRTTGQRIQDLAQYSDIISPMIYPSHFYGPFQSIANPGDHPFLLVSETCQRISALLGDRRVVIRPWIQAFPYGTTKFDEGYILEQLRALDRSVAKGWLLWSAGNVYDTAWKALMQQRSLSLARDSLEFRGPSKNEVKAFPEMRLSDSRGPLRPGKR